MEALANSKSVVLSNRRQAMEFANFYAPEHLILAFDDKEAAEAAAEVLPPPYCVVFFGCTG